MKHTDKLRESSHWPQDRRDIFPPFPKCTEPPPSPARKRRNRTVPQSPFAHLLWESWASFLTLNNYNSSGFPSYREKKYLPGELRLDDCGVICIHSDLQGIGEPGGPEAAQCHIFTHFSPRAICPQRRACLPSAASLYHGSHTGRFLCSSVPATMVSPACPRARKRVRVNTGRENTHGKQGKASGLRKMQIPSYGWRPPLSFSP